MEICFGVAITVFYALGNGSCLLYKYSSLFVIDLVSYQSRMLGPHSKTVANIFHEKSNPIFFFFFVWGHKLSFLLSRKERIGSEVTGISSFSPHYLILMPYHTYLPFCGHLTCTMCPPWARNRDEKDKKNEIPSLMELA